MREIWPKDVKIYWDPWRNIPLIKPKQEEIDLLYQLRLTEPGDARIAFQGDYEKLKSAMNLEFGGNRVYSKLVEGKCVLLNKVPHWDVMYEVVSSGNVIGQLYYDPYLSTWRFRLTYQGAYIAVQENLVETVVEDQPLYSGKVLGSRSSVSVKQVAIVDRRGVIRGIGEVCDSGITVMRTFHERSLPVECSGKAATLDDVVKHNEEGLKSIEEKSINYLRRLKLRYSGKASTVVSYSGGKDSLVALDLAHRAFGELELIFNDTGLELPETVNNVEKVAEHYGYKLHTASAGDAFWRTIEIFGPPGKDYRWCCKVIKLIPIAKLAKSVWPTGALNIVGQRAYESIDRAKSPLVWRNKWIPHMVSTTPIQHWSQLACWLYIFKRGLPYNRLYEEGFDRLGCYLCPSCALAEYQDVKRLYPALWSKWSVVLEEWRRKLGMPDDWLRLGLWRWLTPSTAKIRIARCLPGYSMNWRGEYTNRLKGSSLNLAPLSAKLISGVLEVEFDKDIQPSAAEKLLTGNALNLGFEVVRESPPVLRKDGYVLDVLGNTLRLINHDEQGFEHLVDLLKLAYRVRGCALCGSCLLWTKRGSVKLTPSGPILQGKLDTGDVRFFIDVCPISDQLVEKVVVPLITGDLKPRRKRAKKSLT
ncbi:MAG: phosphoadenosine phosphosulfate reductase family protein [Desulfurococcaceae archaeon]